MAKGRPPKNAAPAPKVKAPAKEKIPAAKNVAPKPDKVVSANDYVNQLIAGQEEPNLNIGQLSPEQEIDLAKAMGEHGHGEITAPANIYHGELLQIGENVLDKIEELLTTNAAPNMAAIIAKYDELCAHPSDINELLPYLRAVSDHCSHITEFGVRTPTSTYALLAGNPEQLVSYDIVRDPKVDEVEALAPNFKFVQGSTLEVEIDETDALMIDTYHTYTQMKKELERHAGKVRKFILAHDTATYGRSGEPWYPGIPSEVACGRGLLWAIEEFLADNPNWIVSFQTSINNGLTVLRRVS